MRTAIYLENGLYFEAEGFGAEGTAVGEIVFNTSMTGYQEIITDPSYAGQFIVFTATEIGNVGVNDDDNESRGAYTKGIIVRSYQEGYSNFRGQEPLSAFLKRKGILGICEADTRALTQMIRDEGAMMMIASTEIFDKNELATILKASPRIEEINYIREVSTTDAYHHSRGAWNEKLHCYNEPCPVKKIIAIDFGAKLNILNELTAVGLGVEVVPHTVSADEIIARFDAGEIGGVFLSNGPGDPMVLKDEVATIKRLLAHKIPMFGICLGHQLLSIAHDKPTYKLKFGHHGGNHPVKNLATGMVEITAQNHNYNVPDDIVEIAEITHINLFDNSIEGVRYKDEPVFSVQYHPESSPGPHESKYLFKQFADMVRG
ncbi:MAG: glutamine-hydrolyzing carbamoyl-phosphate synthase small subunit [Campylobacterales bacterium]